MKPTSIAQLLGIVLCAASVALVFLVAPPSAGWWQKGLGIIFSVGFAMRVTALITGGGPLAAGKPAWLAWSSALPFAFLAFAGLWLPQWWAWVLLTVNWIWVFNTRKMWQP